MDAEVPDGEEPICDVQIVAEVLRKECPSSTFLINARM